MAIFDDFSDDRSARRFCLLQERQCLLQIFLGHAEEKSAAGLRIRQKNLPLFGGVVPLYRNGRGIEVVARSVRHAVAPDKIDNFIIDHRNGAWFDIGGNAAGAAKRNEMTDQAITGDVGRGADETVLGQLGADDINFLHLPNDSTL